MVPAPPVLSLTTGPVEAYPAALRALSRPVIYDSDPSFQAFYARTIGKVQRAFASATQPIVLQGEAILGLEAAAASLIGPGDVVLILASGVYGAGFAGFARRHAKEIVEIRVPYDEAITADQVEEALRTRPDITVVAVCHHDTPSGTINPVREIGAVCGRHGAFMIVDAVSSFGGMDVLPEEINADIFVASPSKCLGSTPGLTLLSVSARAMEKMRANPAAPRGSFLSILDWEHAADPARPFPVTPSIAEVNALDAALDLYFDEGPAKVWARHAKTAATARAGLAAMGIRLWPRSPAIAAPTCTAFRLPEGVDGEALRGLMRDRYRVLISAGRRETAGKLLRIGHMGPTAQPIYAVTAVAALGGALGLLGHAVDVGAAAAAALAIAGEP